MFDFILCDGDCIYYVEKANDPRWCRRYNTAIYKRGHPMALRCERCLIAKQQEHYKHIEKEIEQRKKNKQTIVKKK